MGFYINHTSSGIRLPDCNKATLILMDGAEEISEPKEFVDNLVCIVENGPFDTFSGTAFDAALYCYNEKEFLVASNPDDHRRKRWFIYPHAAKLSGYTE